MDTGKMLKAPALIAATLLALCAGIAQAEVFNFTFTGTPESASGTITTNASGKVTAITGTMTGADKTTITAVDSSFDFPDNILGSASPYVDNEGISWDSADGAKWNLFLGGTTQGVALFDGSTSQTESNISFTVTPAPTPEPSSLLLMSGSGLLAFGIARKRRRVKVASSLS